LSTAIEREDDLREVGSERDHALRRRREFDAAIGVVHFKRLQLSGRQSIRQEHFDIGVPADDVHLFIIQFADDVLDPLAAQADARADRVHFFVRTPDRDLCSITGFARDAPDFNGAIGDFAHFQFKKAAHKIRMTARDNDLRTAQSVFNRDDISPKTVADIIILHHHAFALRHDRLKFSEIENHVRTIKAAHSAADDLAGSVLELFINHFLLDLPNALHHRLFGSLRGDASKISRSHFHLDRVADFRVGFDPARLGERDLVLGICHLVDHNEVGEGADVAGPRVDVDPEITRGADTFLGCRKQRRGNRFEQDFAFDPALPLQVIQHGNEFSVHKTSSPQTKRSGTSFPTPISAD